MTSLARAELLSQCSDAAVYTSRPDYHHTINTAAFAARRDELVVAPVLTRASCMKVFTCCNLENIKKLDREVLMLSVSSKNNKVPLSYYFRELEGNICHFSC